MDVLEDIARDFQFGKYRFTLELLEPARLPEYKGTVLRSGFGNLFKNICCDVNNQDSVVRCAVCNYREKCAYSYILNTQRPDGSIYLRSIQDIPRHYIIEPPLDYRRELQDGEVFEFDLTLIGQGMEFFPYFFVLFKTMGESRDRNVGLGSFRSKYRIIRVTTVDIHDEDWNIIYTPRKDLRAELLESDRISFADILKNIQYLQETPELHLELLTPMDIRVEQMVDGKKQSRLIESLDFYHLIRSLLYYTSTLSYFHCQSKVLDTQYVNELLSKARQVRIASDNTKVHAFYWTKRTLVGYMGDIVYSGEIDSFLPFLYLGEWIHTGKSRVVGLGKYKIIHV